MQEEMGLMDEMDGMAEEQFDEVVPGPESNEEVFPGGPTWADVEQWRSQYGELFTFEVAGEMFIFRLLRRIEYKDIMRQRTQDPYWREEKTAELCVLWPPHYTGAAISAGKAGIPTLVAEQIMEKSGFSFDGEAQPLDPKNF